MLTTFVRAGLSALVLAAAGCSREPRRDVEVTAEPPAVSSVPARSPAPAAAPTAAASASATSAPPARPDCVRRAADIIPKQEERVEIEGLLTERPYADPSLHGRTIMVIRPREPLCVLDERGRVEAEGIKELQVFEGTAAEPDLAGSLTRLTFHSVVLGGGIIEGFTAHHATRYLVAATDVRAAPKRPPAASSAHAHAP